MAHTNQARNILWGALVGWMGSCCWVLWLLCSWKTWEQNLVLLLQVGLESCEALDLEQSFSVHHSVTTGKYSI